MKFSIALSALGWISTFALAWLMVSNTIPASATTWLFFSFFLVVGFLAGMFSLPRKS